MIWHLGSRSLGNLCFYNFIRHYYFLANSHLETTYKAIAYVLLNYQDVNKDDPFGQCLLPSLRIKNALKLPRWLIRMIFWLIFAP